MFQTSACPNRKLEQSMHHRWNPAPRRFLASLAWTRGTCLHPVQRTQQNECECPRHIARSTSTTWTSATRSRRNPCTPPEIWAWDPLCDSPRRFQSCTGHDGGDSPCRNDSSNCSMVTWSSQGHERQPAHRPCTGILGASEHLPGSGCIPGPARTPSCTSARGTSSAAGNATCTPAPDTMICSPENARNPGGIAAAHSAWHTWA
mmetsp:Transcript_39186/g.94171  ORF Transcript_39186/g.94171 Transcript_39186/m.94171 type:complete len:204 (-) Transcript_39186:653-1264(-)